MQSPRVCLSQKCPGRTVHLVSKECNAVDMLQPPVSNPLTLSLQWDFMVERLKVSYPVFSDLLIQNADAATLGKHLSSFLISPSAVYPVALAPSLCPEAGPSFPLTNLLKLLFQL